MKHLYRLDARSNAVACDDALAWADWYAKADQERTVAVTTLSDRGAIHTRISTVFLGIWHGGTDAAPVLWETAVFTSASDQDPPRAHDVDIAGRYTSRLAAIAGHHRVVAAVIERIAAAIGRAPERADAITAGES